MITQFAAANTILQTVVDDDLRGRVMSLYGMSLMGMAPFGSLLAGALAEHIGPSLTVALAGGCCVLAAAAFATRLRALRALVHPIYVSLGIIPQTKAGERRRPRLRAIRLL